MSADFYANRGYEPYGEPFPPGWDTSPGPGSPGLIADASSPDDDDVYSNPKDIYQQYGQEGPLVTNYQQLYDPNFRPGDTAGDPLQAAGEDAPYGYGAPPAAYPNVMGLTDIAEPGTEAYPIPMADLPYTPGQPEIRGSSFAQFIRPRISIFLNDYHADNFVREGWHEAPVPAVNAALIAAGAEPEGYQYGARPAGRMAPQPIFPSLATAWPRARPRWMELGEE